MPNQKSTLRINGFLSVALMLGTILTSRAFDNSYYATSSALSTGQWAKIEVSETGMQFISDQTLRNLGFNDPEKVNVYGYGGEVLSEELIAPDDLPMVGSQRVNGGIVFFGKSSIGWTSTGSASPYYSHISHPYSDNSYYFVSDCVPERKVPSEGKLLTATGTPVTKFTERIVHEQDLTMPMNTGRLILGEDFRAQSSRNFKFTLPGNIGDAVMTVAFGCKTTSGTSSVQFTANGKTLAAAGSDQMAYSSTKKIVTTKTTKEISDPGTALDLTIKFNGGGVVTAAGLDYIEIEYPRQLTMTGGELYFYINPETVSEVRVSGATSSTLVWDVTDPQNPELMPADITGNTLTFVAPLGYREYVAFDPSRLSRAATPAGKISNQDLHALEAPDMLIIAPQEFMSIASRLISLHDKTDGLKVIALTPEEIYNEFSGGKPDVTAYRRLLKMWYDRARGVEGEYPRYCLLLGRPTYDNKQVTAKVKNAGYPRLLIWQSPTGETETTSYSTDDYIGMLEDVKSSFSIGTAQINVAVGRMPIKTVSDGNTVLDKLEDYITNPVLGAWRNNVMVIADDQDNGVHMEQAEAVIENMRSAAHGSNFLIEKLYLDSYELEYSGTGASYPRAHERMMNKWNEGVGFIDYIGHANPTSWGHENMLTWVDINNMSNSLLPVIYAATCEFMRWDADDTSGAEILWLLPSSGVISMICPSREVLISANGVLNRFTSLHLFETDSEGRPLSLGELMLRGKNSSNTGTNKLRYGLIGDPSMRLPWPKYRVKVDEINGMNLATATDYPVLSARSSVKMSGHVADLDGNILEDFNGIAEISLYDAEKVMTTYGNGDDGVVMEYNDRKTRLYIGRAKVVNGKWTTTFSMPSEIENNYSPALISLYAFEDGGRDANGACEELYAFGYDETVPDDFEGPKILEFYLNSPSFVSGGEVGPNPRVYVKFYDESGISVSEAGIGHNLTLELDNRTFFDDVAQYYVPDENEEGTGSISYSLGAVSQGKHTLDFTVWDNAGNSTKASVDFNISALWKPTIETLTTDVNPATSIVNFIVATDGFTSSMACSIDVYDVWGRKVWHDSAPSFSGSNSRTTLGWDLCDYSGARIPGGIYLYRATVKTDNGATVTKTKKLIVAAQ